MRRMLWICLTAVCLIAAPLWASENQPMQPQSPSSEGSGYGTGGMGPGMMGPGSGYHGRGPGMMGPGRGMGRHHGGYGRGMGPDPQGWQDMPPEQQEQWRQMRSQHMQDVLPLRQELSAKQMELETLWDQKDPDPGKVKVLSRRISELRTQLDQQHGDFLMQCRQAFGDRGWTCPGGGWQGN